MHLCQKTVQKKVRNFPCVQPHDWSLDELQKTKKLSFNFMLIEPKRLFWAETWSRAPAARIKSTIVFSLHVLLHVRSYILWLPLNLLSEAWCLHWLLCRLVSPSDGVSELSFGAELIATEPWHRDKRLKEICLPLFFFSPVQVRASATPLPAVMEGRVTTTETLFCAAAPLAGVAAPATQVRRSLHSH